MKRILIGLLIGITVTAAAVLFWNYTAVQKPLGTVIENDPRNAGIVVKAHFGNYVAPNELVFDLKSVGSDKSPADVFRLFLQFSESLKDRQFSKVVLAYNGTPKFQLKGEYFQQLGREYATQNPVYTMRTFPENLYKLDGTQAFGQWTGGWLGVLQKQMGDFTEFHKQWYINDAAAGGLRGGA